MDIIETTPSRRFISKAITIFIFGSSICFALATVTQAAQFKSSNPITYVAVGPLQLMSIEKIPESQNQYRLEFSWQKDLLWYFFLWLIASGILSSPELKNKASITDP